MAIFLVSVGWLLAALLLALIFGPYLALVSEQYPEPEQRSAVQTASDSSSDDLVAAIGDARSQSVARIG